MEHLGSRKLRDLVGLAGEVADSIIASNAEREDAEALWPEPAMRALTEAGLMGLNVPESSGGHGLGLSGLAAVSETLAQESASTAICYAMHCVGTAVIAAKATDYQKRTYLEPIAHGEHITTLALSEPGTSIYFYIPQTELTRTDDHYVLDGAKSFVTNGGHADSYVLSTVAAEGAAGEGTFSCVLVDDDTPGLEWGAPWRGLGMRSNSSRNLRLDGIRVPAQNLLGEEGDQLWYFFEVVAPYFLMAMAGTYIGVARACVEIARENLGRRRFEHTGELRGADPVFAHRLGELWTETEQARRLVYSAAARADEDDPDALTAVFGCKAAAGEAAVDVANEAMTLAGGRAYGENSKLARMLRDARAAHVMAPTTEMLKTWVGRSLLGLPLV